MTKRALFFAAKFIGLSVPLTWLWMEWGRGAYGRFFTSMAKPMYDLMELEMQPGGARERYVNYIPFLVLMFITPRLTIARRVMGTTVGVMAIFTFHLIFSVWVQIAYPEGTRSTTGRMRAFKPGAFELALSTSSPIQPIVIHGSGNALPKRGFVLRGKHSIRVTVLDPIPPEEFGRASVEELMDRVRSQMAEALGQDLENAP